MKNSIKLSVVLFVLSTFIGCASTQKSAKLDIEPKPAKVSHSDESAAGFYQLGQYYESTQRSEQALEAYQEASRLDPSDIKPQLAIAVLNAKNGNFSASISQLKYLVEQFPADAALYNNLGYTYYLNGDYKNAASALGKAIVINPRHILALNNMSATLNKLGKAELANKYAAQAQAVKNEQVELAKAMSVTQINLQVKDRHNNPDKLVASQGDDVVVEPNENNIQTELQQVSAGIYELTNAKTPVVLDTKLSVDAAIPEIQILAQSGGITFKVPPLINKLFKKDVANIASNSDLRNKSLNIKVINGNGIKGFARKTAEIFTKLGISQPVKFANKKHFNQHLTVIEYKVGYHNEAVQLAKTLEQMPMLVETNIASYGEDIRLVLGKDVINTHYKQQQYS